MKKTCILIIGPTAVGKTALAIEIAKHFSTKIISADSRQCYRELNIGVAKPSPEELAAVPHYFIDSHSIHDDISAADYETYALNAAAEIFTGNDIAVVTGGTGLYLKAFCEGLDEIPAIYEKLRENIIQDYNEKGLSFLQESIKNYDPVFYKTGEMQNPQRMIRALEVVLSTGKPISSYQSKQKKKRDFHIIKICLQLPREQLYGRINERVDNMFAAGLLAEVASLIPFKQYSALQTVGYKELFEHLDQQTTLVQATELIKQHTRQYAKRQMTWFKKDVENRYCEPSIEEVLKLVDARL